METSLGEPDPYSSAGAQNWQQNPQLKSHEEHCNHSPANVRQQQTYTHVPHGASNRNYPGSQTLTYTNSNNQPRR
ncbi:Cmi8p KNAG_0C02850 [Huiozyma naganishii CBS 8797]|uniref:Uncharacterized protein n=1 Tax=Huiozyma naganishii (strain ATCC MYA-139 / BCRC 22969 / CBS 8797 / KCTC 17520 / NBRC 10181 / NCYC 3082 / Yp74L-3) TaxID=1071383 RepID=J7S5V9_HUIN7|nr:hypothetical protein KNAG_0C02850 [Kazachstania naganishii CBS 8797]CCK69396.1 hypothetical protein KNAG_0C02850 [Kazachstania naganishii CBS 8797]